MNYDNMTNLENTLRLGANLILVCMSLNLQVTYDHVTYGNTPVLKIFTDLMFCSFHVIPNLMGKVACILNTCNSIIVFQLDWEGQASILAQTHN